MQSNFELFISEYRKQLAAAIVEHPDEYRYPISELDAVMGRMSKAIASKSFNKDSRAFRATCKALKIKHTYRDIETFIGNPA